ncbi:hypothetical protein KC717_06935, partial [Candidatus Dojkabacteria bacterium]|nr:hypothetical protein [Candidatus Dojkabacteria bacterium]
SLTQNDKLQINHSSTSTSTWGTYIKGKASYALGTALKAIYFKVYTPNLNSSCIIGLSSDASLASAANCAFIQVNSNNTGVVNCNVKVGGTAHALAVSINCTTEQEFKIQEESGSIVFYHWNGTSWQQIHSYTSFTAGNYYPFVNAYNGSASGGVSTVDDLTLTNATFTTHTPV